MDCPTCSASNPEVAHFCHRCGTDLHRGAGARGRGNTYAVAPTERVRQFALITSLMPQVNREEADNFRWALIGGGAIVIALTMLGLLPMAIVAGAALVPVLYLLYIYDVNVWEDAPLRVVLGLFALTGVLSLIISLVFFRGAFASYAAGLVLTRGGLNGAAVVGLVMFGVLLPVVAEVAKHVGGVWLAAQPAYDDMIDGLTFGVAAGTAYAAVESLVAFSAVVAGPVRTTGGLAGWLVVIVNLMIVKSVIYGSATGIALATYSGRGEGYDGFTPAYFRAFLLAAGANIVYWVGVRLAAFAPFGEALGLLWGVVVAAFLLLVLRSRLHTALVEAAIEDAAEDRRGRGADEGQRWCPECEMPLLPGAAFCIACGESMRATARHLHRTHETEGTTA